MTTNEGLQKLRKKVEPFLGPHPEEFGRDLWVPIIGVGIISSIRSFFLMRLDKSVSMKVASSSRDRINRVPERTFHVLALFGGWPGIMFAKRVYQHKTLSDSFNRPFLMYSMMHVVVCAFVGYLNFDSGRPK